MTVPLITLFTEPIYDGRRYIVTEWNSDNNVMILELPPNFVVKSMKIDTRVNVLFYNSNFDLYTNFLREPYTGNIPNVELNLKHVRITLAEPIDFKPIFPKRIDPLTEYFHMTKIDTNSFTSNVELYTDYNYNGNKLILMGQNNSILYTHIAYVMVIGVLPDNYEVKSIKIDNGLYVQLFENMEDFIANARPYYTKNESNIHYNFKYVQRKHKYILIYYRNNDFHFNKLYDIGTIIYSHYNPKDTTDNEYENVIPNYSSIYESTVQPIHELNYSSITENEESHESTVQPIHETNYSSLTENEESPTTDTDNINSFDYYNPTEPESITPIDRLQGHYNDNENNFLVFYTVMRFIGLIIFVVIVVRVFDIKI